ncbi:MAG: AAA family ATPase [Rhodospirillales bacterium]|nr:AAA family ATPase [Rhodospirillales bacterium]
MPDEPAADATDPPRLGGLPPGQRATAALLQRLADGADPIETHISVVFVGADTVWKLKKAVKLAFLDFTRPEDRRRFADRELALNAPAAPGLYRDVVPVLRRPDGTLALGHPGAGPPDATEGIPVDWVLRMARVPADDFLDVRAARGLLDAATLDGVADAVVAYHAALPPIRGVPPDMHAIARGNVRSAREAGLPEADVAAWETGILAALDAMRPWMTARAEAGFVRRCHGDLHLGNLCLWQGRPVPFDALEFDEAMATIDLAYDRAFLLMDLDCRVDRAAANRVMNRIVGGTGDVDMLRGLPAFLSLRAMVRAHVEQRRRKDAAADYLAAARAALQPGPVGIVAIGGLPGTGKSTLARSLAPELGVAPGALILRSDEIRKRRFGVPPEQRLPPDAYAETVSTAVIGELAAGAEIAARAGHAVIADATFLDPAHRAAIAAAAARAGVPFLGLWLQAPLPVLEARIAARRGDASDATVAVLHAAAARDPGAGTWQAIDATDPLAPARRAVQNWK